MNSTTVMIDWHTNCTLGGVVYPTRSRAPRREVTTAEELLEGLTQQQHKLMNAVHEAGHAVAVLAAGGHLHRARLMPDDLDVDGAVEGCGLTDGRAYAAFAGAGERAADRWLRESGLWTPGRAVAVEIGARGDRRELLKLNPHIGFGDDERQDYRIVHDLADALLDQHWEAVTTVAAALMDRHHLDGATVAALAGLPNGPHHHTGSEGTS
ncbi:hypothetical protein ACFVUY_42950 [Kitasatospora sp. NPDC058063]|uniref:hypothetical protein n=1 Tax=unclassified Kitasatospora TaxID=2633591 RepID=UPI0036DB745C